MLPWFFRDAARLALERAAIEELGKRVEWLVGVEWQLDNGLILDAVIRARGHDYELRVSFPLLFPDAPPAVRPRNMQRRLSTHQYGGADGPLCLEWGPDNWHSGVTCANMLESAFRLLDLENPLGDTPAPIPVVAPSRHSLSVGQSLRSQSARWYVSPALLEYLTALPAGAIGGVRTSVHCYDDTCVGLVHAVTPLGGSEWGDPTVAKSHLHSFDFDPGAFFKTTLTAQQIGEPGELPELAALLADYRGKEVLVTDGSSPLANLKLQIGGAVLIVDAAGAPHFFMVYAAKSVTRFAPVTSPPGSAKSRSPQVEVLAGKSIAIIGVGSVGSTIALGLARAGVGKFHLVDHDILLPENLRRNALDWRGVLLHKVDAVKAAIARVAPICEVKISNVHLTGQESNAFVGVTLNQLADCDLLVDATGNAKVFNILAAIAKAAGRPLVWMEVFGGGIGGLVARSRPSKDPVPHEMRNAFLQYCQDHPDSAVELPLQDYAAERDGKVIVASDAEAAIIAHTAVRMIVDCLAVEPTKFPHSMYLVGFEAAWVFSAPFATIPIAFDHYTVDGWKAAEGQVPSDADAAFLVGLLQKKQHATDSPK